MKRDLTMMNAVNLAGLCMIGLAGCASPEQSKNLVVYGRCELPVSARVIGLSVCHPCPEFALQLPMTKSEGAQIGAIAGARDVAADPEAAFLFPAGFVMGGIMGGLFGVSADAVNEAERSIVQVGREHCFVEELGAAIMQQLNASNPGRIRTVADNIPAQRPEIEGHMERGPDRKLRWRRSLVAAHPLQGTDYDTVIGIRVGYQGFQVRPNPHVNSTGDVISFNPPLAFSLIADVKVMRIRDWAEIGGLTVCYEGKTRKFTEWATNGAAPLRQEMAHAYTETLDLVRSRISCETPPPPQT